jgi:poly-gamma-glutamate synthesis protein (capsule biosynthesis protein)
MRRRAALAALSSAVACGPARPPGENVTVVFVGDILLDSGPGEIIAHGGDPFAQSSAVLAAADLVVGNLECPIAASGTPVDKIYTFRADPRVTSVLADHVGAVSLANNHSGDQGRAALSETMTHLRSAKIPYFGAGPDLASAHAPLIVERKGLRIALLGYDEFHPRTFEARVDSPGVAWSEEEQVRWDLKRAREAGADVVLPFLHWGWENSGEPSERQRNLARAMIDAGADAVIGAHPHVTQGTEEWRGHPIVYSLGNFVFDLFDEEANRTGWILQLTVNRNGVSAFETITVHLDDHGAPAPISR